MNFAQELEDLIEDYLSWKDPDEEKSSDERRLVIVAALQNQLTRMLEN